MIEMKGRYYNAAMKFSVTGLSKIIHTRSGEYNVFHVTEFSLNGKKYIGTLPY
jgi:hypothetical protein